jgi:hypothetical protein
LCRCIFFTIVQLLGFLTQSVRFATPRSCLRSNNMLTKKSSNHAFDMVPSSPTRQHKWRPLAQGYGRWPGATGAIIPIMTTTCVLRAPCRDRKPGRVLRALQTAQGTTRSPGYVWWPVDGLIPHAAHGAHIPNLLSTGLQATRMWRDGAATP